MSDLTNRPAFDAGAHERARERLAAEGLWRPEHDKDACGVGVVAAIDGEPKRAIVEMALQALKAVWHRGAVDADGKTGDGAGLMVAVPQDFFRAQVKRLGRAPVEGHAVGVGQIFLPRADLGAQDRARAIVESELLRVGVKLYGWRQTPVDPAIIGEKANATRPEIEQVLFHDPEERSVDQLERDLTVARRRIEKQAISGSLQGFYICSLSTRVLVYKGMFLAAQIGSFYPDLRDPSFISSVAIFHQRYSTNTFPEWRLAQPFRALAHNGEINTLKGNINWMRTHEERMTNAAFGSDGADVRPIIQPGSSDSAALDQVFEIVVRSGRSAPFAKALLIPEAWSKREDQVPENWRALYGYCNAMMEPWDGPAAICAFDGRWAIAGLDRNGLRPLRWALTDDGVLSVGSETGMCPVADGAKIIKRGAVPPGRMIGVNIEEKKFFDTIELLDRLAESQPYGSWLENVVELDERITPKKEPRLYDDGVLRRRQAAAGLTLEDLELILQPMAEEAKEAIGSMGDDAPLAVLSDQYRPLAHFFRQNFSQVTNPPIDPLREGRVMSLKTRFKNLGKALDDGSAASDVFTLESPILTNGMYARFREELAAESAEIDATYERAADLGSGQTLRAALERIREEAAAAVRGGAAHIVITDEAQSGERAPIPGPLAVGAVHGALVRSGLRASCSINVRAAEALDPHSVAVLIGLGATTVNPYLALDTVADRVERGQLAGMDRETAAQHYKTAIEQGLLKIMSKMGIAVVSSYRGGGNFEALGLSRSLLAEYFLGVTGRISGVGLAGIEKLSWAQHDKAWAEEIVFLPVGGFYRYRSKGERHSYQARMIHDLQTAVREEDYAAFKRYAEATRPEKPLALRDLLETTPLGKPAPIDEVESINSIRKRFVTPGMSLGALSPEAHGTLNIAMNRIGAKSVSGEGGEDPARYIRLPNGDNANSAVKQIASGRFGVSAEYLNQCREIEIKVAQGAKPGEGGQLPGFKVTEFIARMRHSTPGVMLISPPPHHDIYSIEDLAQLIYDLKQINPDAEVCVKLVAGAGVGAIAAGVAKAKADVILISGHVGGTGASPQTSIKFAGLPWEMGLAEANQTLTLNGLRHRVKLRTDGGLKTGRDIVIAAMLGAEEYGVGTASLVAMGCLYVRQCHSNTCPVGVCTQDPELREKFTGKPEYVVNLMTYIAEDVREHLARLGARSLNEIIGRADLLAQVLRGAEHLDDLDLNPLLVRVDPAGKTAYRSTDKRIEVDDTLDAVILSDGAAFFERGEKMQLTYAVKNTHRAIGARVSSAIVRKWGMNVLPEGQLSVRLRGSVGQSLGAFAAQGLRIDVDGDANDYVGKGLSGATIALAPQGGRKGARHGDAIIGNTCLYGATAGFVFAAGRAGERFAVRNSGAVAVVEGCGANGCEYMTGGEVVILGAIGDNFAAGMTGGCAYVYDPEGRVEACVNADAVNFGPFLGEAWEKRCKALLERHVRETQSPYAAALLKEWRLERKNFVQITPKELEGRLVDPIADAYTGGLRIAGQAAE